ncbi:MAG: hypothetical protein C0623_06025 [Desulfuromonas sp.]|nr:MAG: hypothetical protein C0623_06025 [Desulfuromonas sp.]
MSLRILVIDDEESIRDSLALYFREKGYDVVSADHPARCDGNRNRLCHGYDECADVLIIDQWMPEMTGLQYLSGRHDWGCRAMAQHKALMSANLPNELRAQAIELGCKVFAKPVRFADLDQWLESVVRERG